MGSVEEIGAVSGVKGVSYLGLQNVISIIARILAFAFLARIITVGDMGLLTILNVALSAAYVITGLGLGSIVTKLVAEKIAQGRRRDAASVYYVSLVFSELASVFVAAWVLISRFPAGVLGVPITSITVSISVLFAIDIVVNFNSMMIPSYMGLSEFRELAIITTVNVILRQAVILFLVYETGSLVGLVAAWVLSDLAVGVYMIARLARRLGKPTFKYSTKSLLRLSSPLLIGNVIGFAYNYFDRLLLFGFSNLTALGVYGAAAQAFDAYSSLIAVIPMVLLPIYSGIHGRLGRTSLEHGITSASRYASYAGVPIALMLCATANPSLTLLVGNQYQTGGAPLAILALSSIATIFQAALGPTFIVLNETTLAALTTILPVLVSVPLGYISIHALGILGASIVRGISMLLGLMLTFIFLRRKISLKFDYQATVKSLIAGAAMVIVVELTQAWWYSKYLLPLYVLSGFVTYIVALRVLRSTTENDIDLLRRILGPRFSRLCDLLSRFLIPRNISK